MKTCSIIAETVSSVFTKITSSELASSHEGWHSILDKKWKNTQWGPYDAESTELPQGKSNIYICGECSSTLDVVRIFLKEAFFSEWDSVLSLSQKNGRGQLRRSWLSPAGNLYCSLRLPAEGFFAHEVGSLVIGYLLSNALQELGYNAQIKWPNDILIDDAKVGGILLEERNGILMAGIGLNVHSCPPDAALRAEWAVPAGTLCKKEQTIPILQMWQVLVDSMHFCYNALVVHYTTAQLISSVERNLAWLGRTVFIHGYGEINKSGKLVGISSDGGLRIRFSDGERTLHNGSISLHS